MQEQCLKVHQSLQRGECSLTDSWNIIWTELWHDTPQKLFGIFLGFFMNIYLTSFIIIKLKVLPCQPSCKTRVWQDTQARRKDTQSVSWHQLFQRKGLTGRSCCRGTPSKKWTWLISRAFLCFSWPQENVANIWELWLLEAVLEKSATFPCEDPCQRSQES